MKNLYLILYIFVSYTATAQIVYIPDANFKNLLVNSSTSFYTSYDCTLFSNYKIDFNNNGEIEVNEALAVCQLNLIASNINDLTGIEAFTNLKILRCDFNNLTNINLSQLIHLEGLNVRQNQLTSLDLSNLPNLKIFDCYNNQISSLNFANNPLLEKAFCNNNQLSSLDFSNNPLFNELDCINNLNLTSIKIKNGTMQLFGSQTYYNHCWTGTSLNNICADANEIPALQSFLTSCGVNTNGINITNNCSLSNEEYNNNSVSVYPNPSKGIFKIDLTNDSKLIIYDLLGKVLLKQDISSNLENTIDLTNYATGVYFAKIIDFNKNFKVIKLIKN